MTTTDHDIRQAAAFHGAGRGAEAARLCRQILSRQGDHPEALNLLGVLTAQAGHLDEGVRLIRAALSRRPDFHEAWSNLGVVLVNQGRPQEALDAYRHVAALRPADPLPYYAAGILQQERGKADEAVAAFAKAAALKPDFVEAYLKLGLTLRAKGRLDDAIAAYAQAIAVRPDYAHAHNNLGNALRERGGRLDDAIAAYTTAIRLNPDDPVAHLNLATSLADQGRFVDALPHVDRALTLKSDFVEAHAHRGTVLGNLGRFDEAVDAHARAIALAKSDPGPYEALGHTLLLKKAPAAAATAFRRALRGCHGKAAQAGNRGAPTAWNGLGSAHFALGRFKPAADCFRRAVAIDPDKPLYHKNLACTGRQAADPGEVARLAALRARPDLPETDRIAAAFALGKLLDDADRYDEAFAHFADGNRLVKESRTRAGDRFDPAALRRAVDRIVRTCGPRFFADRQGWGQADGLPVFIVGMPRSGTSLVEQIAASHSAVHGAGELTDIANLSASLAPARTESTGDGAGEPLPPADRHLVAEAAAAHLRRLRGLGGQAARVIDKLPGNLLHLATIAVCFPGARVIFCRRDPRDTCLSCYFQWFANKGLLYTYDLVDCAHYHRQAQRLATHWQKALPLRTLDVCYEDLVARPEPQTRRLIDFLGLSWEPACLDFHRNPRPVLTASAWQVRQPIYNRSVNRWQHYRQHLGPLIDVLTPPGSTWGKRLIQT